MNACAERAGEPALVAGRATALVVWSVWLAMVVGALLIVARDGSNVPSWDDWDMVPTLTGEQPVTLEWLWSQHNEHRVPLPRLFTLALARLTVVDFRVLMVFDVLALASMAAAMLVVAGRLRGRASLTDAFFPLVLLHWGHATNLLWGWQIEYFASVVLSCIALIAIVLRRASTRPTGGFAAGICILLLPLCGATGLVLVPALAAWLAYSAWLHARTSGASRRDACLLMGLAAAALLLVELYFIGWERVPWHPTGHSVHGMLENALRFATIGLGPATRALWPYSGFVTFLVSGLTGALLARVCWREPRERGRAAGLLLFLGAMAALALAIGTRRNGFEPRYVLLAVPAWCCMYFAWSVYGSPRHERAARALFLALAGVVVWPNTRLGESYGQELRSHLAAFERDMAAGVPMHELIHRYGDHLHPHHDIPTEYLPMLRRAGIGAYRLLHEDPPFREVAVALDPIGSGDVEWSDSTATLIGPKPWIEFGLPADVHAAGIRLRYEYHDEEGTLPFVGISWKRSDQVGFPRERSRKYSPTGDRANWERGTWSRRHDPATTMTVWVADPVGQLLITANATPGAFVITELVLLVPKE